MLTTTTSATVNPFVEAAKSSRRRALQATYVEAHLLRSMHAFVSTMPPATAGAALPSRWAQAAPILADCADWAATQAADPEADAIAQHAARLSDAIATGEDAGCGLRNLLTVIIKLTPVGSTAEAGTFLAVLDGVSGLHLDLNPADPTQVESFSTAAMRLVSAFSRGDGLSARDAVNELLSFVPPASAS